MRDQTPAGVLEFLGDDDVEVTFTKIIQTMNKVTELSSEIIYPTLETGSNTSKLITFLEHLDLHCSTVKTDTIQRTLKSIEEISKIGTMTHKAIDSGDFHPDSEHISKLNELRRIQGLKIGLWRQCGGMTGECRGDVDTMLKVARSLLAVQEGSGEGIKSDVRALGKVTISVKILDAKWVALRARCGKIGAVVEEIEGLSKVRGVVDVQVVDEETGERSVVAMDLAELSVGFLEGEEEEEAAVATVWSPRNESSEAAVVSSR